MENIGADDLAGFIWNQRISATAISEPLPAEVALRTKPITGPVTTAT